VAAAKYEGCYRAASTAESTFIEWSYQRRGSMSGFWLDRLETAVQLRKERKVGEWEHCG
jgi:hypothetical protein